MYVLLMSWKSISDRLVTLPTYDVFQATRWYHKRCEITSFQRSTAQLRWFQMRNITSNIQHEQQWASKEKAACGGVRYGHWTMSNHVRNYTNKLLSQLQLCIRYLLWDKRTCMKYVSHLSIFIKMTYRWARHRIWQNPCDTTRTMKRKHLV